MANVSSLYGNLISRTGSNRSNDDVGVVYAVASSKYECNMESQYMATSSVATNMVDAHSSVMNRCGYRQ